MSPFERGLLLGTVVVVSTCAWKIIWTLPEIVEALNRIAHRL